MDFFVACHIATTGCRLIVDGFFYDLSILSDSLMQNRLDVLFYIFDDRFFLNYIQGLLLLANCK